LSFTVLAATVISGYAAANCSPEAASLVGCTNEATVYARSGNAVAFGIFGDNGNGGIRYRSDFYVGQPGSLTTAGDTHSQRSNRGDSSSGLASSAGTTAATGPRAGCIHDDWAFLSPAATSGLQCSGVPTTTITIGQTTVSGDVRDPRVWAALLEGEISLPPIHIRMNPSLGLVNVPTWFWVEGYDGGTLSKGQTITLRHQECHDETVTHTDENGNASSSSSNVCNTITDFLTVEVRLFPARYLWSFGDGASQPVSCSGEPGSCRLGLGSAFQDPFHPSPIAHPYVRSSLHVGGAYAIGLGIDFAAQYRFNLNDGPMSGWADLPGRHGSWSASHPVQEAQAVLVKR
jgi:hypothetical protein